MNFFNFTHCPIVTILYIIVPFMLLVPLIYLSTTKFPSSYVQVLHSSSLFHFSDSLVVLHTLASYLHFFDSHSKNFRECFPFFKFLPCFWNLLNEIIENLISFNNKTFCVIRRDKHNFFNFSF